MNNIFLLLMAALAMGSTEAWGMGRKVITVQRDIPLRELFVDHYQINFLAERPGVPVASGDEFGCQVFSSKNRVAAGRYVVRKESSTKPTFGGNLFTHTWSTDSGFYIRCGNGSRPATESRLNSLMQGFAGIEK